MWRSHICLASYCPFPRQKVILSTSSVLLQLNFYKSSLILKLWLVLFWPHAWHFWKLRNCTVEKPQKHIWNICGWSEWKLNWKTMSYFSESFPPTKYVSPSTHNQKGEGEEEHPLPPKHVKLISTHLLCFPQLFDATNVGKMKASMYFLTHTWCATASFWTMVVGPRRALGRSHVLCWVPWWKEGHPAHSERARPISGGITGDSTHNLLMFRPTLRATVPLWKYCHDLG